MTSDKPAPVKSTVRIRPAPPGMSFQLVTTINLRGSSDGFFLTCSKIDPVLDEIKSGDGPVEVEADIVAKLYFPPNIFKQLLRAAENEVEAQERIAKR